MAVVTFFSAVNMLASPFSVATLNSPTSTSFTIQGAGTTDLYGGNFSYVAGLPIGSVQTVTSIASGALTARYSGLNIDASLVATLSQTAQQQALQKLEFAGDDIIYSTASGSTIQSLGGNDHITLSGGGNSVDGGTGTDTAFYSGKRGDYTITAFGDAILVSAPSLKADTLVGVERIKFADGLMAYDAYGNTGMAYRLYQAAFARTPDQAGVSFWISALDTGTFIKTAAQSFVTSGEFKAIYGDNPGSSQIVDALYTNVLGRKADAGGLSYWTSKLQGGMSVADLLFQFAESSENHQKVDPILLQGVALDPSLVYV